MDNPDSSIPDLAGACARITLDEEEEGGLVFEVEGESLNEVEELKHEEWLLLGKIWNINEVNFDFFRPRLAAVLKPQKGMSVKQLQGNMFVIKLYHEFDYDRVLEEGPWSVDNQLILITKPVEDVPLALTPMTTTEFWIQIYDLQEGFRAEIVFVEIGNFIGKFVKSDPNNFSGNWRSYFRIRVTLDVSQALRRKMKIKREGGTWFWINFKYERLPHFCFYCGYLGHTDTACDIRYKEKNKNAEKAYGVFLRAPNRKPLNHVGERYLRDFEAMGSNMINASGSQGRKENTNPNASSLRNLVVNRPSIRKVSLLKKDMEIDEAGLQEGAVIPELKRQRSEGVEEQIEVVSGRVVTDGSGRRTAGTSVEASLDNQVRPAL